MTDDNTVRTSNKPPAAKKVAGPSIRWAAWGIFLAAALCAASTQGATLAADYRFEGSLKSSVAGAPDAMLEGAGFARFRDVNVLGVLHPVLDIGAPGGLQIATTGIVDPNHYSAVILVSLNSIGSYVRILDNNDASPNQGWFLFNGGLAFLTPNTDGPAVVQAQQFAQITLVKDGSVVRGYANGAKQFEIGDTNSIGSIGTSGLIRVLRQADSSFSPGGQVARVRLFQGALIDTEVASLDLTPALTAVPPTNPAVVADYRFESSLRSSIAGASDASLEGVSYGSFLSDTVLGAKKATLEFGAGGGIRVASSGLLDPKHYTMVALFQFASVSGYARVVDSRDTPDTQGLFLVNGQPVLNPYPPADGQTLADKEYAQVVLVNDGLYTRVYRDGVKYLDLFDSTAMDQIGTNGVLHFFRQADGAFAPGGRVARLRLFNGAMSDADVAAIVPLVPPTTVGPSGSTVVADYRFEGNLASSVAGGPLLQLEGGRIADFVPDTVFQSNRTVLEFAGTSGLLLDSTGLVNKQSYTISLIFEFPSVSGYARLVDARDPPDSEGLFLVNGLLLLNPYPAEAGPAAGDKQYSHVVLVNNGLYTRAYRDGVKRLDLLDNAGVGAIGSAGLMHLFRQSDGSYAPGGRVARVRLFNGAMNDAEVASLGGFVTPAAVFPSPSTLVADYQFQDTLASSITGAPDLVSSASDQVGFADSPELAGKRTLRYNPGSGLLLDLLGIVDPAHYSVVVAFAPASTAGYVRIVDPKNPTQTQSWFLVNGGFNYLPFGMVSTAQVIPGVFTEVAFVVDGDFVTAYSDGDLVARLVDPNHYSTLGADGILNFFRQSDGNYASGGNVSRIRVYNGALNETDIAQMPASVPRRDLGTIPPGSNVALSFNEGYLTVPDTNSLSAPYTVEFWALPTGTSSTLGVLGSRQPGEASFDVKFSGINGLQADIGDGNSWLASGSYQFPQPIADWVHVAYVVRPTSYEILINGQPVATNTLSGPGLPLLYDGNHQLRIGLSYGSEFMQGAIDEVRIWDVARTDGDIASAHKLVLSGNEAGLVHYYRFSEGRGSVAGDLSKASRAASAAIATVGNTVRWIIPGPVLENSATNQLPDLVISGVGAPTNLAPGETVPIVYTVSNDGTGSASGPWVDGVFLSQDPSSVISFRLSSFVVTNTLPPGASMMFTQQVTAPLSGPSGNLYFVVGTDVGNAISESNEENNNLAATNFTIIPGTLSLQVAASVVRDDVPTLGASVTRNGDLGAALTVSISSSDISEATAPSSVVIAAGQATESFLISIQQDGLLDGPRNVTLAANAPGFLRGSSDFTVLDSALPALGLSIPAARLREGDSVAATLTRQGNLESALAVAVSGSSASLLFPASIIIPAGQSNAVFTVQSVNDSIPQSSRTNLFTISAQGYLPASGVLIVDDNDVPAIQLRLTDHTVSENAGPQATTGTVTRDRASSSPLTLSLTSGNPSAAQVPATVTIPAGATSAIFSVLVVDNTIVDGTRTVAIGAALVDSSTHAILAQAAPEVLTITDNDGPSLGLELAANVVRGGLNPATTATVSRSGTTTSSLAVSLSSSATAQATTPPIVTIASGAASATFPISSFASGNQAVVITASAIGFAPAARTLVVSDANLPDLVVTGLKTPGSVLSDSVFSVSFRIENRGFAPSGTNFLQRILLSSDPVPSADDRVLFENAFGGSIPVGSFFEQTFQLPALKIPGDYWIIVITDAENSVPELLENNNSAVSTQVVHVEKAYSATLTTATTVALPGTPIVLKGRAVTTGASAPAPFVVVDITVRVRNTERHIAALTDANGNYQTVFNPLPGEGGSYSLAADYPGVTNSPTQASFIIPSLSIDIVAGGAHVAGQSTATFTTPVHNLANFPLTKLSAVAVSVPPGVSIVATVSAPTLNGDADTTLGMVVTATSQAQSGGAVVRVTSQEGAVADLALPVTIESFLPRLVASPSELEAGMRRGGQSTVQIGVTNSGGTTTGPLNVLVPAAPWLKVASGTQIPALAPGAGTLVSLLLTPAAELDLGPYSGSVVIDSTNVSVTVPFTFRNLSDSFGSLRIETVDEYTYYAAGSPNLTNAVVRILDSATKQVVVTNVTGVDGSFSVASLPEAYYDLEITADGHSTYKATILVEAAKTKQVTAFLSRQTVRYLFSVVPTDVEDRTRIEITTTFETFVPIPVLTADPVYFDLSNWSGSATQVNITLSNHGLLAAQNVQLALPTFAGVDFSSLISQIGTLPAQSSITLPIVIRKTSGGVLASGGKVPGLRAKASPSGGSCYADASFSFDLVCGPQINTYNVPLRFDRLPGCSPPPFSLSVPYFAPFNYVGGGPVGGGGGWASCPECFSGGPQLYSPPRIVSPPNNCDPCLVGLGSAIIKCAKLAPPAKAGNCALEAAKCAYSLLGGVTKDAAVGCLGNAGTCLGGAAGSVLGIPGCVQPLGACFGGGAAGPTSLARVGLSSLSSQGAGNSTANVPSEAQPYFLQLNRAIAFVAPLANVLGGDVWLQDVDDSSWTAWFTVFAAAIQTGSPAGAQISAAELSQLLALPLPSPSLTPADARQFVARWNRSLDYYSRGIFTVSQVPTGESSDFVATDVSITLAAAAIAANDGAVADGYEDPINAVYQAGLEFVARANSSGGGSCARVVLKIEQEAVITRDGFNATLEIANDTDQPLTGISVELNIHSAAGEDTTSLFSIRSPTLTGMSGVDGSGQVAPQSSGKASWILIPTSDAAPDGTVIHVVGGTLRYQQDGAQLTIPLLPSSINVLPNASLSLKYFHQRDVFADDPFTEVIEPSIPFSLAVMIQNSGKGLARNVHIASAQPKIVENSKGLLIDFSIIATEVDGQSLTPSLTAQFGDVAPGEIKIGRWLLKASLQGLFTDYSATFENLDGLGDKRLSLIQSVEIHEMDHIVNADRSFDDGRPDFLANDVPDFNNFPDTLYLSQGSNMPVVVVTNAVVDAPVSTTHLLVGLSAAMPAGWGYLRVPEPSDGAFRLIEVRRSDNSLVSLDTNVWVTDRTFIGFSQKPVRENALHLLDYHSSGSYSLLYAPRGPVDITAPTSSVAALPANVTTSIPVSWRGSDGTNGSGIAYYNVYVSTDGGAFALWLAKTTDNGAIYDGEVGHSYAFYSLATDLAGNQQTAPATPDAHTTVSLINTAPVLTPAAPVTIDEGETLNLANTAFDADLPPQTLTWSLGPGAPAGAQINPANGVVRWATSEVDGPSTNHFTIVVSDNGQPSLSATGLVSVIVREVNSAPVIAAITNRVMGELRTLTIQAEATDSDLPVQRLTYSLVAPPTGAGITTSGLFSWTPTRLQGPSTNFIQIKVTDNGTPPLSATQTFTVIVRDSEGDILVIADSMAALLAPEMSSGLSLNSGLDITTLSFDLAASSDRLRDVTIQPLIPEISTATLTPDGSNQFHVVLVAAVGELLQGNRAVANLAFNGGSNVHSELLTLSPQNITAIRSDGQVVANARGVTGRLHLIGLEPLIDIGSGASVQLMFYGVSGHSYNLEERATLTPTDVWRFQLQYDQTNLLQTMPIDTAAPSMFYRLREN